MQFGILDLAGSSQRGVRHKIGKVIPGSIEEKALKVQESLVSNDEWWKIFSKVSVMYFVTETYSFPIL